MPTDRAAQEAARALDLVSHMTHMNDLVRPRQKPTAVDFYVYNASIPTLGGVTPTLRTNIQTQSDSDFVVCAMSASQYVAASSTVSPLTQAFIQITDLSDGKKLFNDNMYGGLVMGIGGFPFVLPCPKIWRPNANIQIDLINPFAGGAAVTIDMSFSGMRIYYA